MDNMRKEGYIEKRSKAITKPILTRMIEKINTRTLRGKRDRAILEFGFYTGGRRRSEIASAEYRFLSRLGGGYEYLLHRSKTDQAGEGAKKILRSQYARSLAAWLDAAKIKDGYLFRTFTRKGGVSDKPIEGETVNKIIKQYVEMVGEDPKSYSAHGLRRGFITYCGRIGIPIFDVMECTGHKDIRTVHVYYEEGKIDSNPATKI